MTNPLKIADAPTRLPELVAAVSGRYGGQRELFQTAQQVAAGRLSPEGFELGDNRYALAPDGWNALGLLVGLPTTVVNQLDTEERSYVLGRRLALEEGLPPQIRFAIDAKGGLIAAENAALVRLGPSRLLEVVSSSLPEGLAPEDVVVDDARFSEGNIEFGLHAPSILTEPRPGDVLYGGVWVSHFLAGRERGTQVRTYQRRLVCSNGMTRHICRDGGRARIRRGADLDAVRAQISLLCNAAWQQVGDDLEGTAALMARRAAPAEFTRYLALHRVRLMLSNCLIRAIEAALLEDELEPSGSWMDLVNAISRIATHGIGGPSPLSDRQRYNLLGASGEFAFEDDSGRCPTCGCAIFGGSATRGAIDDNNGADGRAPAGEASR